MGAGIGAPLVVTFVTDGLDPPALDEEDVVLELGAGAVTSVLGAAVATEFADVAAAPVVLALPVLPPVPTQPPELTIGVDVLAVPVVLVVVTVEPVAVAEPAGRPAEACANAPPEARASARDVTMKAGDGLRMGTLLVRVTEGSIGSRPRRLPARLV